jgi:hypothetical protein
MPAKITKEYSKIVLAKEMLPGLKRSISQSIVLKGEMPA